METEIDLNKIADLLAGGLSPRPHEDWRQNVEPYTSPFLRAISEAFSRLTNGRQLSLSPYAARARRLNTTLQEAAYELPAFQVGGHNSSMKLTVLVGYANRPGGADLTGHIVWGLSWWGKKELADRIAGACRSIELGTSRAGFRTDATTPVVFGGCNATVFRTRSGNDLRGLDASELINAVAADLAALLAEMEQKKDEFLRLVDGSGNGVLPMPTRVDEVAELVKQFRQVILYGPPGTGKTRLARQVALRLLGGEETITSELLEDEERMNEELAKYQSPAAPRRFELIVFHPSYEYEQFIGGVAPQPTDDGKLSYVVEEGTFLRLCGAETAVLVIDEINRGNLSKLLGELIYALEYREQPVTLPFRRPTGPEEKRQKLSVPKNLYIVATMNSSDRSIGHIDVAVRRRFGLVPIHPDKGVVVSLWKDWFGPDGEQHGLRLAELMEKTNRELASSEDGTEMGVGQSYFLPGDEKEDFEKAKSIVRNRWKYQVIPLLVEYRLMANVGQDREADLDKELAKLSQPEAVVGPEAS